jgi:hypothetical protein
MKVTDTLSPVEQQKLDMNNQLATSLLGTAQTGLNNVNQVFSTPFDSSNLPAITTPMGPAGLKEVSDALLARLQPQLDQRREALRTQNVNTGFAPGSTGYDQGMDEYWRSANDMQLAALAQAQQAASTSYGMEADARTKALQEQLALRQLPLNEINALRTGNQAALPQFQQYQGQSAAPAPIMQGAIAQGNADIAAYNADAAASGNLMGGLFDLGGAALASPWLMSSDRRLKKNIKRVGTHTLGIGIYEFDYVKGGHAVGVMSDEVRSVLPQAVVVDADGFDMVDYSLL